MNRERWMEIEFGNSPLTQEEIDQGYHFCYEWDEMCIGPDMPEWDVCLCDIKKKVEQKST